MHLSLMRVDFVSPADKFHSHNRTTMICKMFFFFQLNKLFLSNTKDNLVAKVELGARVSNRNFFFSGNIYFISGKDHRPKLSEVF